MPASTGESWYLDPLVARQKRDVHQAWFRRAMTGRDPGRVLKTDLFEEANGDDRIFHDLFPRATLPVGIDIERITVRRASLRDGNVFACLAGDARSLPFASAAFDSVVSPSTLDHFDSETQIALAVAELARVLRPGGILMITLDNPWNPTYHLLRWFTRNSGATFLLGRTLSLSSLVACLRTNGLEVRDTAFLIHNPRGISTALFIGLRRMMGRSASPVIRMLLKLFALAGETPLRRFTGCFIAVNAVKSATDKAGISR